MEIKIIFENNTINQGNVYLSHISNANTWTSKHYTHLSTGHSKGTFSHVCPSKSDYIIHVHATHVLLLITANTFSHSSEPGAQHSEPGAQTHN